MRSAYLENHRAHDYRELIVRWRAVARASGLRLERFAEGGGYPIYCLRTRGVTGGGLYISAGIHGDEPAGAWGLLDWATRHLPRLAARAQGMPLLVLPCLNPWGLVNNRRSDREDHDLNRLFDRHNLAPISELKTLLEGRRFELALHLHEDFDAQGNYLYELRRAGPSWGHGLLAECSRILPVDLRARIDRRVFDAGLYLRQGTLRPLPVHPEAIYLYQHHCPHVITFETPSEFSFQFRVRAQVLLIEECVKRLFRSRRSTSS